MRFRDRIRNGGWGAVFLTIYTFGILYRMAPEHQLYYVAVVVPTLAVMFLAEVFSFRLIHFFAGGELVKSTEEIARQAGENFYEGTSEEVQSRVNDLDERAYQDNISILSGVVIALSAPVFGYLEFSLRGLGLGLVVSALALRLLSKRGIESLNELAEGISRPYEAKHENQ